MLKASTWKTMKSWKNQIFLIHSKGCQKDPPGTLWFNESSSSSKEKLIKAFIRSSLTHAVSFGGKLLNYQRLNMMWHVLIILNVCIFHFNHVFLHLTPVIWRSRFNPQDFESLTFCINLTYTDIQCLFWKP